MSYIQTVKVKATDPEQGAFVIINEVDFDPAVHEAFEEETEAQQATKQGKTTKQGKAAKAAPETDGPAGAEDSPA